MSFIHVENVTFRYGTDDPLSLKEALSGVSLAVERGEFVALLGHNGCGKSTLAKHFNAMLLPTSGKVFVDGMDTTEENLKYEIRRRVGLVLQNPDNQLVAYKHDGFWQCMDTQREKEKLEQLWASGNAPWKVWNN